MSQQFICPQCHQYVSAGQEYCTNCRVALDWSQPTQKNLPYPSYRVEIINTQSQNPQQSSESRSIDTNRLVGFIVIVTVGLVLAYTLLEPFVRSYVYWVVGAILILLLILVICSISYPTFRQGLLSGFKSIFHLVWRLVTKKRIDENNPQNIRQSTPRMPIPMEIRRRVHIRAGHQCQWEGCHNESHPEIHHIDRNRSNNQLSNLILLCGHHHNEADHGAKPSYILHYWAKRNNST